MRREAHHHATWQGVAVNGWHGMDERERAKTGEACLILTIIVLVLAGFGLVTVLKWLATIVVKLIGD